ncbi:glycosyltransferase [Alicyclobacillus fructus]|uniref:glycosyltransferase n=1 Tax=Alicyclobacillus fructus TaxID=2816082 RepID=UPI001A8C51DE
MKQEVDVLVGAVVITRNEPDRLEPLVREIHVSAISRCVVVSDDSDEPYASITKRIAEDSGAEYVCGPKKGPVANRLNGLNVLASRKDITHVLFIDGDIQVDATSLQSLHQASQREPGAIICVGVREGPGGRTIWPTEVNWKGVRCRPAPQRGGTGLSDQLMLWPLHAALAVEWDTTYNYGYSEAWLGVQARSKGYTIVIIPGLNVVHTAPNRDCSRDTEEQRIFYNFLIKRETHGRVYAWMVFVTDMVLSCGKRALLFRRSNLYAYLRAAQRLISLGKS